MLLKDRKTGKVIRGRLLKETDESYIMLDMYSNNKTIYKKSEYIHLPIVELGEPRKTNFFLKHQQPIVLEDDITCEDI